MAQKIARSLNAILKQIENDLDQVRDVFLTRMAEDLVSFSPVDTGAYVTSHSITTGSGSGRMRKSDGKPTGMAEAPMKAQALDQLLSDIAGLPQSTTKVYMNNRSPHNKAVEFGGFNWKRDGYYVYQKTRARAGQHLSDAVNEVKTRQ